MKPATKQRIAALGIAAAAVIAIQGTVSGAGDDAPDCQIWHPHGIVVGDYQHTWNPSDAVDGQYQHTWNPPEAVDGQFQHSLNPDDAVDGLYQHTLNPEIAPTGQHQHSWNPTDDGSGSCPLPSE